MNFEAWRRKIGSSIPSILSSPTIRVEYCPGGVRLHTQQSQTAQAQAQAQGIYVCKITGKSGAFYQVDVYAEGINNPATASGVYAYPLNLNFGASLPLGTLIMCSDQSFTATPSGGV